MDFLLSLLPSEFLSELSMLLTIITLLFYLVECFCGYRLIRSWISFLGFVLGALGGYQISALLFQQVGAAIIGAIIGGFLLSILSYKVYLVGIFFIAAYGVFQLGLTFIPLETFLLYIVSAGLGILAGYIAVKNMRPAIIIITAMHGGLMAADLLPQFISLPSNMTPLICGLIIGGIGILVQFLFKKK